MDNVLHNPKKESCITTGFDTQCKDRHTYVHSYVPGHPDFSGFN